MPRRKPRNKGVRPSKWTPEVIANLAVSLNRRTSMATAAGLAKVGKSTLYCWIRLAEEGDPRFAALLPLVEGRVFQSDRSPRLIDLDHAGRIG